MLIVQNNKGDVVGANSYVSFGYAGSYLAPRINLSIYTDDQIAQALIDGTALIDGCFYFLGSKMNGENQTTAFPRYIGDKPETAEIPEGFKEAVCEYAIYFLEQQVAMLRSTPEEYYGDKYNQADNPVKTYVRAFEAEVADGKKYIAISEKFMYESGWLVLIA